MCANTHRFLNEPDNAIVAFFVINKKLFPIVYRDMSPADMAAEFGTFGKSINAKYTGFNITAEEWNFQVRQGTDPLQLYTDIYAAKLITNPIEEEAYGVM